MKYTDMALTTEVERQKRLGFDLFLSIKKKRVDRPATSPVFAKVSDES
jgi:hypothetical protein